MQEAIAIKWQSSCLLLLDQRLLPAQEVWIETQSVEEVYRAIKDMVVRGAPAIGIAAAYGAVFAARESVPEGQSVLDPVSPEGLVNWQAQFKNKMDRLADSRPTAVNLFWALDKIKARIQSVIEEPGSWQQKIHIIEQEAIKIHEEDLKANHAMGELGAGYILRHLADDASSIDVMTHCNAGAIATGGYGTALGVVRSLWSSGKLSNVYADETRPWLQGARLTAWELQKDGIPVTLNADSAAAHLIRTKNIKWIIVGADRITANGDVANKIGTYGLAVLARYHQIKFMVVAPSSTIDMSLPSGQEIPIEERSAGELTHWQGNSITPAGIEACNPVFDVTDASLVDIIVTEKGVVEKPNTEKMKALMMS
jgi:methylthioribose-1-phosphate isomerase